MEVSPSEILDYLQKTKREVDRLIEKYLPKKVSKDWLKRICGKTNYSFSKNAIQKAILDPIWDFLERGGKRWRPALFLLTLEALGKKPEKYKDFSIIPEILHEGCLPKETLILKSNGNLVPISKIKKGDEILNSKDGKTLKKDFVVEKKFTGVKKIFLLKAGKEKILATKNHPFLTKTKNKFFWKKLEELKRGDEVLIFKRRIKKEKVNSIAFFGESKVYDLMVKNSHNFFANNFLVHNSLIVDDIEDRAETRRGKLALHRIFGEDVALNAGNFLYFLPIYILKENKKKIKEKVYEKILEIYLEEMEKLHFGQGTDIFWHRGGKEKISEKMYFQMTAFKTGCMARLSMKLAGALAEKDGIFLEKIGKIGELTGIAFQIQDDILDLTLKGKEREKFGKSFGNDIEEGKRSLIVILSLKKLPQKKKKRLIKILDKKGNTISEKKEAIKLMEKCGAIFEAKKIAESLKEKVEKDIEKIFKKSKARELLKQLVSFLISRKI